MLWRPGREIVNLKITTVCRFSFNLALQFKIYWAQEISYLHLIINFAVHFLSSWILLARAATSLRLPLPLTLRPC
jgi:hypothetical protein